MSKLLSKVNSNSLLLVLLPIMFIPVALYNTTLAMVHVWTVNETFTHGFLVLPLVLWLIWREKTQLLSVSPCPEPGAFFK